MFVFVFVICEVLELPGETPSSLLKFTDLQQKQHCFLETDWIVNAASHKAHVNVFILLLLLGECIDFQSGIPFFFPQQ